ncbi:MAG: hypothetical protein U0746_06480 [Gemmataceae bacterium]
MPRIHFACFMVAAFAPAVGPAQPVAWKSLAPLPDPEGFAGSFAGVSRGTLLVAGGANFPGKKPWDGGQKVWTDSVFALDRPDGRWAAAGKLPRPLAYGVSVTYGDCVVCVGGCDAARHYADAFRLEWATGKLAIAALPPLPRPIANACGALVGTTLYVAGGQDRPDATATLATLYALDLADIKPSWRESPLPGGGRMLAVAAAFDGAFWLIGGVDLFAGASGKAERRYLSDAFRYDPSRGWTRVAGLPRPVTAAPSPALASAKGILVLGGDDGSQVGQAPDRHRGFTKVVLRYDASTNRWNDAGELPAPRVTVPCVRWGASWVVPSGEMRPGVRSPEVWAFTPQE